MEFKGYVKLALIFIVAAPALCLASTQFSEEQAFVMLYGNYDSTHQISIWENVVFPSKRDKYFFWDKKTAIVSSVLFVPFKDNGIEKYFLLTKSIPVGIPFDCHACAPLIGAAIFKKSNHLWKVESQNRFLLYADEYGKAPLAKFVVKKGKPVVELQIEYHGEGVTRKKVFLVLSKNNIKLITENDHAFTN